MAPRCTVLVLSHARPVPCRVVDAPFAVKPTLTGQRVVLRPFTDADIAAMGPVLADPEVLRLTGSVHTTQEVTSRPRALSERELEWYRTRDDRDDRLDLAIVDRATDGCVGEVVLNEYEAGNQSCGFRILVGPAGRGRGLGSEVTRLVLDHAFSTTDLHRIELEVYAFNPRALHVYEKVGFVVEGRRRHALRYDGERVDAIGMAVLRHEWAV
jgi:RimJ/RimL family protein N-acetyltransferase